jgi:Helix-turn-helix domain
MTTSSPSRPDDDPGLVPLIEVARILGISPNTAYRHREDFPIAFERIGVRYYARRADLEAYLAPLRRAAV